MIEVKYNLDMLCHEMTLDRVNAESWYITLMLFAISERLEKLIEVLESDRKKTIC